MVANKNILICGAGISGLTLAYWLDCWGFSPTIVEKRPNLQDRGYMIDFYGSGFDVADKMNLVDHLRVKADQYPLKKLQFVDRQGKPRARLDIERFKQLLHNRYFPMMRGDLEQVLYERLKDKVPIRFGTSIAKLNSHQNGVRVELSYGNDEQYDLVVGADGIHSNIRGLLWGDEAQFNRFLGFYVACSVIPNFFENQDTFLGHFEPNLQTAIYSIGNGDLATFFAFRSEKLHMRDRQAKLEVLRRVTRDAGWVVPQLVEDTRQAEEFFFDAVDQIQLDTWYKERVVLVGDACQCLTLLAGQGASMSMTAAFLLAEELHKAGGDYQAAFPVYQQRLQPEINRLQKDARGLAGSFVPRNKFEIALSHFFLHAAFWPGFRSIFAK